LSGGRKPATEATARRNREAVAALPQENEFDLADASRGLVARFEPAVVKSAEGRLVWDQESYGFLHHAVSENV
jgi:alkyl sulfatase BDS1-like metallo-beta-lactamase superfamily hydrolase